MRQKGGGTDGHHQTGGIFQNIFSLGFSQNIPDDQSSQGSDSDGGGTGESEVLGGFNPVDNGGIRDLDLGQTHGNNSQGDGGDEDLVSEFSGSGFLFGYRLGGEFTDLDLLGDGQGCEDEETHPDGGGTVIAEGGDDVLADDEEDAEDGPEGEGAHRRLLVFKTADSGQDAHQTGQGVEELVDLRHQTVQLCNHAYLTPLVNFLSKKMNCSPARTIITTPTGMDAVAISARLTS